MHYGSESATLESEMRDRRDTLRKSAEYHREQADRYDELSANEERSAKSADALADQYDVALMAFAPLGDSAAK